MKKKKTLILRILICLIVAIGFIFISALCFKYESKSGLSGNYYYLISYGSLFVFAIWYALTLYRLYDGKIKSLTLVIFCLGIFWLLDNLMMWLSESVTFSRYCWYLYYLPIIFIPYFFFILCAENFIFKKRVSKIFIYIILGLFSGFLLFVALTNDIHHQVYSFEKLSDYQNYIKQPMFYVIVGYSLMILTASIVIFIFSTTRRNSFTQLFFPFIFFLGLLGYSFLYIFGYDFIKENLFLSDVALVYNLLFVILFELLLNSGLIQNNGQYISRFNECSLPLKIVDIEGEDIFVNDGFSQNNYLNKSNDDLVYIEKEITGGKVIVQEDLSKIKNLNAKLNNQISSLIKGNEILKNRKEVQEEKSRLSVRTELYNEIESVISKKSKEIDMLVSLLPDEINNSNKKFAIKVLGKIRLRIGYLKQKCLLILQTKSGDYIQNNEFRIMLNVICSDVKNAGFDSFVTVVKGNLNVPIKYVLALNELIEYIGENFGFKRCVSFVTCNVDKLRCIVKVESENKKLSYSKLPIEVNQYGYKISIDYNENEYTFTMKGVGKNGTNL